MNAPEDGELVRLARDGDARAFETLAGRHYDRMYAIAFKWARNRHDAEDIAQNACINMARGIRNLRDEALFTTWLYRIVINAAKDYQRQAGRILTGERQVEELASKAPDAERSVMARQALEEIYALPEKERDALLLVFGEGLSHAEAAKVMGCAETTVSWRIFRARNRLAEKPERKGEANG